MERYKEFVAYYTLGSIMREFNGDMIQDNQTLCIQK